MGRRKVDRSSKVMQSFETTKPLQIRLKNAAIRKGMTTSALIRYILEQYFEERNI